MQNVQSPLKSGLACLSDLISCFSPSTTLQSHLQLYFCSSVTPRSFIPQDFCSDCLRSSWPSSLNADFSLNVTSSERPFLPLQSEVEPPNHYHLLHLIFFSSFISKSILSIQLSISSLSRMSTRFVQYPVSAQHLLTESIHEHLFISVLVLGKEKPLLEFAFPFLRHIFM